MEILKYSEETRDYMNTITRQLESLGVLEEADKKNLDLLASQYEMYIRALDDIDENGLTCTDQRGRMAVNPAFSVARSCMSVITALLKELSISCRQRRLLTRDAMVVEENPLDVFLNEVNDL